MKVQIINHSKNIIEGIYTYSTLAVPRSLDEFDVNIIDLRESRIWYNNGSNANSIISIEDFKSLGTMVQNSNISAIVYVFPQDIDFNISSGTVSTRDGIVYQYKSKRLKDVLNEIQKFIIPCIVPGFSNQSLVYENTTSEYGLCTYSASFYFYNASDPVILSCGSKKATMIQHRERMWLTTLDILADNEKRDNFIYELFGLSEKQIRPSWMDCICFCDDEEQMAIISTNEEIIKNANESITNAKNKLNENNNYKSILYTNGGELVEVVFSMLERMLSYDLSDFKDEKKEDFLIKKVNYTLIGEIKGVTSNIKNEHIAQIEYHFQNYLDKLIELGEIEDVHQILIINPFRNKPLIDRDPVNDTQIKLAKRNGCLIVETSTLLKMFEKYILGEIDTSTVEKLFTTKTGLLKPDSF